MVDAHAGFPIAGRLRAWAVFRVGHVGGHAFVCAVPRGPCIAGRAEEWVFLFPRN